MSRQFYVPGLPIGWFLIGYESELEAGAVKPLRYFGKDLVLFRTESGEVALLDAFCPHLGAHLGHGGKVKGEEIECPFHAWRFGSDGQCKAVPYAQRLPRKAEVKKWHVRVVAHMILAWHHPERAEPAWDPPADVPEHDNDEWTEWERKEWTIRAINQEMAENAVDSAHFHYLHGTTNIPESEAHVDGPIMTVSSPAGMSTPRGQVPGKIESKNYGFGIGVVRFTGIVETLNIGCTTPIDDETVVLRFNFKVKKMGGMETNVGKAFIGEVSRQVEQDIPIWENKIQLERPLLCDGDGPIGLFRRWSQQFYVWPEGATETAAE